MKVKIEIDAGMEETEVTIRCRELNDSIVTLQNYIQEQKGTGQCLPLYRGETEYYVEIKDIYFFETEGRRVFAHTSKMHYEAGYKLYELEELLPHRFMRISKPTIVNLDYIYSITRNLTASSVVEFMGSNKTVLVSRGYYRALVEELSARRLGGQKRAERIGKQQ